MPHTIDLCRGSWTVEQREFEGVVINRHRRVPKDAIAPQYGADEAPELAISMENRSVKPRWLARSYCCMSSSRPVAPKVTRTVRHARRSRV